jgi:hypothetical protein
MRRSIPVTSRPYLIRAAGVRLEYRRDRRRLAQIASAMHAAGWPDHAISRVLHVSRRRLPRLMAFGGSRLGDLKALVAAELARDRSAEKRIPA